jgi:hypothetical protein
MPHHFRKTPSSRRAASLTAKWVVPGPTVAAEIKYGRRTTHIIPCKPSHHRRRFHEGQRLSVKSYVGGATECHVTVTSAVRVRLGDVDYPVARELGYVRLDDFRLAWVAEHDPAHEGDLLERFDRRHAHKEVWLLRFAVERALPPRLLAERSDELYVENPARALDGEPEALTENDWKRHIDSNRDLTHGQWLALGRLELIDQRARAHADRGRRMRNAA